MGNPESTEKAGRQMCHLRALWTVKEQAQLNGHGEAGEGIFRERRDDLLNISAGPEGNILTKDKASTELLNGCLEHKR